MNVRAFDEFILRDGLGADALRSRSRFVVLLAVALQKIAGRSSGSLIFEGRFACRTEEEDIADVAVAGAAVIGVAFRVRTGFVADRDITEHPVSSRAFDGLGNILLLRIFREAVGLVIESECRPVDTVVGTLDSRTGGTGEPVDTRHHADFGQNGRLIGENAGPASRARRSGVVVGTAFAVPCAFIGSAVGPRTAAADDLAGDGTVSRHVGRADIVDRIDVVFRIALLSGDDFLLFADVSSLRVAVKLDFGAVAVFGFDRDITVEAVGTRADPVNREVSEALIHILKVCVDVVLNRFGSEDMVVVRQKTALAVDGGVDIDDVVPCFAVVIGALDRRAGDTLFLTGAVADADFGQLIGLIEQQAAPGIGVLAVTADVGVKEGNGVAVERTGGVVRTVVPAVAAVFVVRGNNGTFDDFTVFDRRPFIVHRIRIGVPEHIGKIVGSEFLDGLEVLVVRNFGSVQCEDVHRHAENQQTHEKKRESFLHVFLHE